MPNLATALKDEITRLARKQQRPATDALRKTVNMQRSEIAALKRRLLTLERVVASIGRQQRSAAPTPSTNHAAPRYRFTPEGLARDRERLALSAADYGLLVGASGQSVYGWESGKTAPRPQNIAAMAALRGMGKKAAAERLVELKESAA